MCEKGIEAWNTLVECPACGSIRGPGIITNGKWVYYYGIWEHNCYNGDSRKHIGVVLERKDNDSSLRFR